MVYEIPRWKGGEVKKVLIIVFLAMAICLVQASCGPDRSTVRKKTSEPVWTRFIIARQTPDNKENVKIQKNGTIELVGNNTRIYSAVVMNNAAIRAKVKKISGQNLGFWIGSYHGWFNGRKSFGIGEIVDGDFFDLKRGRSSRRFDDFFEMMLELSGNHLRLYANGEPVAAAEVARNRDVDQIAVSIYRGAHALFRDIEVRAIKKPRIDQRRR
jgi:hypothetical protein